MVKDVSQIIDRWSGVFYESWILDQNMAAFIPVKVSQRDIRGKKKHWDSSFKSDLNDAHTTTVLGMLIGDLLRSHLFCPPANRHGDKIK